MALPQQQLSLADYLAWENEQDERHEYYRGEVFAMVGVKRIHGLVTGNVFFALKQQLKGKPCQVFSESLKVQVGEDMVFYPDVFVTCDAADLRTDYLFRAPSVIVEVLSESTRGYDYDTKFAAYRRLPALREYLLIDPENRRVDLFRRGENGLFTLYDYTGAEDFPLEAIACRLSLAEIFDGIEAIPGGD